MEAPQIRGGGARGGAGRGARVKRRLRLAVICDAVEEGWRSMDYVAEMLVKHLQEEHAETFETLGITPRFFRGFEQLGQGKRAYNADRAVTRFLTYPVALLPRRSEFDLFHIADHSYAHLAHVLPRGRTGVFCHDLDAFEPALPRNGASVAAWRWALARVQLGGLQRAAVVFHSTQGVRGRILDHGLVDDSRLVEAPYGVSEEFWNPSALPLPPGVTPPFLLQVGGNFPRKRLDVLFRVFAEVQRTLPNLQLVQQGATLDQPQQNLVQSLGIGRSLVQPTQLSRAELAALYARAELVLVPSDREGFGLPVLEALAAGACVVASDISSLREVGGSAVTFCPVADVSEWVGTVSRLLRGPEANPPLDARRRQARRFTWRAHAEKIASSYQHLAAAT
jgi:glycosyltransferase involved in cell wall biosynthesis